MLIVNPEELKNYLETETSLVVYCSTEWCGPCKTLSPLVDSISKNYTTKVVKIDLGAYPEVASELSVRNVPTMIFYKKNQEVVRTTGIQTQDKLKENFDLVKTISRNDIEAAQISSDEHE